MVQRDKFDFDRIQIDQDPLKIKSSSIFKTPLLSIALPVSNRSITDRKITKKLRKAEPLSFLELLRIPTTAKLIGGKHRFTS